MTHNVAKLCEVAEFEEMQLQLLPTVDYCFVA